MIYVRHKRYIPAWEAHGYSRPARWEYIYLVRGGTTTGNYYRLLEANAKRGKPGAKETRRRGGHTDWKEWQALAEHDLVERRETGPRGGSRWHTTRNGKRWLKKAQTVLNATRHAIAEQARAEGMS